MNCRPHRASGMQATTGMKLTSAACFLLVLSALLCAHAEAARDVTRGGSSYQAVHHISCEVRMLACIVAIQPACHFIDWPAGGLANHNRISDHIAQRVIDSGVTDDYQ